MRQFFLLVFFLIGTVFIVPAQETDSLAIEQIEKEINETDYLVIISTKFGDIKLILYDDTPLHKQNFINMIRSGVFENCTFHRVIDHFMIQGGNPYTKPEPPSKEILDMVLYKVPNEQLEKYTHVPGAIAMARQGDEKNPERKSSSNQFYIVENRAGAHHLDGKYTVFGRVMAGMDVVERIAEQKTDSKDKPVADIRMSLSVVEVERKNVELFYNYKYLD